LTRKIRIILTFALVLLLGLPAGVAYAGEWIRDSRTGCGVWNSKPKPNESITWSGSCVANKAKGQGTLQWFKDGKPSNRYEGQMREGQRTGRGTYFFAKGDRYEGEAREDKRHGRGIYTHTNGDRYDGEWRDGKRHGRGVYTYADGSRQDGKWRDGKYEGKWRDDEFLKKTATKSGERDSETLTYSNGDRYQGSTINGERHGHGIYSFANGNRYEGDWVEDRRNGQGIFIWSNGSRYEGPYLNDMRHGEGLCRRGAKGAYFVCCAAFDNQVTCK